MNGDKFRFKACTKCYGDLGLDEGDWICMQCGTYCYVELPKLLPGEKERGSPFKPRGTASTIEKALVDPKTWLVENAELAKCFEANKTNEEISGIFDWKIRFVQTQRSTYQKIIDLLNRRNAVGAGI